MEIAQKVNLGSISEEEKSRFACMIEDLVWKHDVSYLEAVTHYCEDSGMEIEIAATLIGPRLKSQIEMEAISLRYLPKSSRLPL